MKGLLLDTHTLLWMVVEDERLAPTARSEIERADRVAYSVVSFWEIALKMSRHGFEFELPSFWDRHLTDEMRTIGALRINLEPEHCRQVQLLPWHHKDPFDRMLVAQALVERLPVLTADRRFQKYGIRAVW